MQDTVTTSWRRSSDAVSLQRWEADGGKTAAAPRPARMLIVDNDMGAAESLELMLRAAGDSETRVAYSGEAALAIAAEFQPDVVLLDLSLVDMTGFELARSLREQAQGRELRLIAVTSAHEPLASEQARMAGLERYLLKPVASLDLSDFVARPAQ